MKLDPSAKMQLLAGFVGKYPAVEASALVDDACELLTDRIVLWLRGLRRMVGEDLVWATARVADCDLAEVGDAQTLVHRLGGQAELLDMLADTLGAE